MKHTPLWTKDEITLIDFIDPERLFDKANFEDFCEVNGFTIKDDVAYNENGNEVTSFYDFARNDMESFAEDIWSSLRKVKDDYIPCIVTGKSYTRYPEFYGPNPRTLRINEFNDLYKVFIKCATNAYQYSVKIKDNVIYFTNANHDGTDYFEIRLVTDDAYQKLIDGNVDEDAFMKDASNFEEIYCELFGLN